MNSLLNSDFEKACLLFENETNRNELYELLKNGTVVEKQVAALKLDKIECEEEAEIFISNLTGCDGKIREVIASRLSEFSEDTSVQKWFSKYPDIFANATIDIDSNVCRNVIDVLPFLKNDKNFAKKYSEILVQFIKTAVNEIQNFSFRDKKYRYNKQYFKLYWSLEGLCSFADIISEPDTEFIIKNTADCPEYTVREKLAKFITFLPDKYGNVADTLKNDENYYVKNIG